MNPNIEILPNGVAVVKGDTHHARWCATEGLVHDKWMAKILVELIHDRYIKVAVDGGANIGTLTQPMQAAGASVCAFEPNPDAADCLAINCPEVTLVRAGLAETDVKTWLLRDSNVGAGHITPTAHGHINRENEDAYLVDLTTLDSYNLKPGLIKLDLEGCELRALRGAKRTLAENRPVIIAEVNSGHLARYGHTPQDLFAFLAAYGYKWRVLQPDCNPGSPQYDIIAEPIK